MQRARDFRWAATMVRLVVRCGRVIVNISASLTTQTAVELQWHTLHSRRDDAQNLSFDPSIYSKTLARAQLPKWARLVMEVDPTVRSERDRRRLHALLRPLSCFGKFTEKIQLAMCRAATYQRTEPQRVILRKGHRGENFYLIYSGSVFVNVEDVNAQGETFTKTEVVLTAGHSFGELSLLQDIPRTVTVTCRETCELIVVDRHVFSVLCPRIFDKELEEKIDFLSRLPLFHSTYWSREALHNICFEGQIQEFKTNKVVVRDSHAEEWMYICMEGQCRIVKCMTMDDDGDDDGDDEDDEARLQSMITAEFLDFMKNVSERSRPATRRSSSKSRQSSLSASNVVRRRELLLKSLANEYDDINNEKSSPDDERRRSASAHADQPGMMTLSTLIRKAKAADDDRGVHLDIGTLREGEVFDLDEVLQPSTKTDASSLILVSSGARLLRIQKRSFRACLSQDAMEHAKHITLKQQLPSRRTLSASFQTELAWSRYKNKVMEEILSPERDKPLVYNSLPVKHKRPRNNRPENKLIR